MLSRKAIGYLLGVEIVAAAAIAIIVSGSASLDGTTLRRLAGLLVAGLVYAELVDRVERVWIWLHTDRGASARQAGVLLFAGVLVLPMWAALVQTVVVYLHTYLRNHNNRTRPAFQLYWSATTVAIGAMAASAVFHHLGATVSDPSPLDVLAIAVTLVVYTGVNLCVLLSGMFLALRPEHPRSLIPTSRDIGWESVMLLLGVLGAVLIEQAPLLLPAIPLLAAFLHRSTLVRELVADATIDAKTGLLTSKAWDRESAAQLARCQRELAPIALLMLDLDHFKSVNDQHGHATGDAVLEAIGGLLRAQVRTNDIVGRYGGEEFVVLLPDTTVDDATEIADRVRRRVSQLRHAGDLQVTTSIGVAAGDALDVEIAELFAQADAALYRSKAAGRDRVSTAAQSPLASASRPSVKAA